MASADVTLKDGLSYTISDGPHQYKFVTDRSTPVSGADFIDRLKTISCLIVTVHEDKPVTPLKAKPRLVEPDPLDIPEPEPDDEGEPDEPGSDEGESADEPLLEDGEAATGDLVESEPEPEVTTVTKAKAKGGKKGKA